MQSSQSTLRNPVRFFSADSAVSAFNVIGDTLFIQSGSTTMGLLERVGTLVKASLNDLIDKAENPSKMIKQVMLDMENQLLQVKTQVAISIADQHMLEKKE